MIAAGTQIEAEPVASGKVATVASQQMIVAHIIGK